MIAIIRRRYAAYRRARALRSIRRTFALFGYDLGDMTDEEIEQGVARIAEAVASAGFTTAEVTAAMQAFAQAGT